MPAAFKKINAKVETKRWQTRLIVINIQKGDEIKGGYKTEQTPETKT